MKNLLKYLFLLFPAILNAQFVAFQYDFGYGSYKLEDVRAIHDRIRSVVMWQIGARTMENFPNHYIHSGAFGYIAGQHNFGISGAYLTTGGRVHVADYSGEYKTDMVLTGTRFGGFYRYYTLKESKWLNMYLQIAPGVLQSRLKIDEKFMLGDRKITEEKLYFFSRGMYIEPSAGVCFKLLKWSHLSFGCGYEINAWGKMEQYNISNNSLKYQGDDKIRWDGFRLYASLILTVPGHFFKEVGN